MLSYERMLLSETLHNRCNIMTEQSCVCRRGGGKETETKCKEIQFLLSSKGVESVAKDDSIKYKAVSTIGGYRSAITALYKEHHMSHLLPRDVRSEFLSGYKRTI